MKSKFISNLLKTNRDSIKEKKLLKFYFYNKTHYKKNLIYNYVKRKHREYKFKKRYKFKKNYVLQYKSKFKSFFYNLWNKKKIDLFFFNRSELKIKYNTKYIQSKQIYNNNFLNKYKTFNIVKKQIKHYLKLQRNLFLFHINNPNYRVSWATINTKHNFFFKNEKKYLRDSEVKNLWFFKLRKFLKNFRYSEYIRGCLNRTRKYYNYKTATYKYNKFLNFNETFIVYFLWFFCLSKINIKLFPYPLRINNNIFNIKQNWNLSFLNLNNNLIKLNNINKFIIVKNIYLTKYFIIIKKTKNNWFLNLTDSIGNPKIIQSCGFLKPKTKKLKKSKENLEELCSNFFTRCIQEEKITFKNNISAIYYKSNYRYKKHFFKIIRLFKKIKLHKMFIYPNKLIMKSLKSHNGLRKKKLRRI